MSEYGQEMDKVLAMAPYIRQLYGDEIAIGIGTTDKYIYYEKGKHLEMGVRPGDPIKQEGTLGQAISKARRVSGKIPREVFGVPNLGIGIPIMENNQVVGGLAVVQPVDVEEKLLEMAQNMNASVESVSSGSSGLAASTEELAATSAELASNTEKIRDAIKGMDSIITLIMEIASQTHLLGLNAAIEAARAGDLGRGFNVVAEEIRKLAGRTQASAKEVTSMLTNIGNNINALAEHVLQVSAVSQEQAATSEEITSSIKQLEPMTKDLIKISAELVK